MKNKIYLKNCDKKRVENFIKEISKLRWWITGWEAGRSASNEILLDGPPKEVLRQMEIILKNSISEYSKHEND